MSAQPVNVQRVGVLPTCEAGLFDRSFACDETKRERIQVGSCVAWLCSAHRDVINIQPTAAVITEQV
jgi:hypothetical protein